MVKINCISASSSLLSPSPPIGIEILNPPDTRSRHLLEHATYFLWFCSVHFGFTFFLGLPPSFAHLLSVALSCLAALAFPPLLPILARYFAITISSFIHTWLLSNCSTTWLAGLDEINCG